MKKSIISLCGLLFFAAQSCDVLDKDPVEFVSTEETFANATEETLQSYCNNFYPDLLSGHGAFNGYSFGMLEGDFQSDNILPWTPNTVAFSQHTISTSDKDNWKWEVIRACNSFLEYYELSPASESIKQRYAGEILFFKSMDYFNKVRRFGDVPWYDHVLIPGDEDLYKARDSRTVVMANVLKDINQAIAWLPTKATTGVTRVSKDAALALKARMCLFEGTYRRYHNIEGDTEFLQAAYDAAGELMKPEYGYSLFQGSSPSQAYHELFIQADYENNPEIILSREYDPALGGANNVSRMIGVGETPIGFSRDAVEDYLCAKTGKPITLCGCEGHTTHTTLVAELNNRDPRLLQTVDSPEAGEHSYLLNGKRAGISSLLPGLYNSSTGYAVAKFFNPAEYSTVHHQGTLDAPLFRYAEILLVRAEAGAELGLDPELNKTINALRDRVGFTHHLTANPEQDPKLVKEYPTIKGSNANLIREIRRERRVELMFEGYRFDDLRRWKKAEYMNTQQFGVYLKKSDLEDTRHMGDNANPSNFKLKLDRNGDEGRIVFFSKPVGWVDRHYLFPLPSNELLLNQNLDQNEGYPRSNAE